MPRVPPLLLPKTENSESHREGVADAYEGSHALLAELDEKDEFESPGRRSSR